MLTNETKKELSDKIEGCLTGLLILTLLELDMNKREEKNPENRKKVEDQVKENVKMVAQDILERIEQTLDPIGAANEKTKIFHGLRNPAAFAANPDTAALGGARSGLERMAGLSDGDKTPEKSMSTRGLSRKTKVLLEVDQALNKAAREIKDMLLDSNIN
jgi:hypothetical protein